MKKNHLGFIIFVLALLFLGAEAFAAGSSSKPAQDTRPGVSQYNDGVKLMKKGKYEKAAKKFEAALKKNPKMAEAHNNLGYSLRKQGAGNFDRSLSHYNRAIELNPQESRYFSNRGNIYFDLQQNDEALADYNHCIALNPRDKEAFANRGAIYGREGQWNQAINDLNQAIALDPDFFNAYMNRAVIHSMMEQRELAIRDYYRCLELEPDNDAIWNALAIEYQHLGDFEASVKALNTAITYNPQFGLYYVNRGISYKYLQRGDLARKDFDQARVLGATVDPQHYRELN